ncbi:MAG: ankyrin repeat domain-containing protein [bacterium]
MINCWKTRRAGTLSVLFCLVLFATLLSKRPIYAQERPMWQQFSLALSSGDVKKVEALIKKGADVNGKLESYTPLGIACEEGHLEIVRLLLKHGARADESFGDDSKGYRTPMQAAAKFPKIQALLVKAGASDIRASLSLVKAVKGGNVEQVRLELKQGADPNYYVNYASMLGLTDNPTIVELLLKHGANIHLENYNQDTPFRRAFRNNDTDTIKLYLKYGKVSNLESWLKIAKKEDQTEMVKVVEDHLKSLGKKGDKRNGSLVRAVITNGDLAPLKKRLDSTQLSGVTKSQLRIIRNTIFAQYGYRFRSKDLQAHFGRFSWYKPRKINIGQALTATDKANLKLLKRVEREAK